MMGAGVLREKRARFFVEENLVETGKMGQINLVETGRMG